MCKVVFRLCMLQIFSWVFLYFVGFFQNWLVHSLCVCVYIFYLSLTWIFISRQTKFVCCTVLYVKSQRRTPHTTRIHNSSFFSRTHTQTHAQIHTYTYTHFGTSTHARAHTLTYAHACTRWISLSVFLFHIESRSTRVNIAGYYYTYR